jgi:hypothetical protein
MNDPSPWFALAGVLVGGAFSFVATSIVERSRWKRQREARWDSPTLEAYISYAITMKTMGYIAMGVASHLGWNAGLGMSVEEGKAKLAEAEVQRANAVERLWILAPKDLLETAGNLNTCLWRLKLLVTEPEGKQAENWSQAWAEFQEARHEFYRTARRAIDLKDSSIDLFSERSRMVAPIEGWGPVVEDVPGKALRIDRQRSRRRLPRPRR